MTAGAVRCWVLLRGLGRGVGHWGDFPLRLNAAWPQTRVVTIDLPGNGALHRLASPGRIAAMTEHARGQVQALGIGGPYHLLALSLGGMVAADWATRHPHELAGSVLINTSLRPFSPWYRRLRPAAWPALAQIACSRDPLRRERTVLRLTSRHCSATDPVADAWTRLHISQPVSAANLLHQLLAAARYRAANQAPAVRLLVLASTRDGLVDVACSRALAKQWSAPLIEHPAAGHDLPLDDADWLLRQLATWADGDRI